MGRSASAISLVLALAALSACATTQEQAARLRLNGARLRASQLPFRVGESDRTVRVAGVALLRSPAGSAVVVTVVNPGRRAVSDLPVAVGVTVAGKRDVFLNEAPGLDYFDTHLPSVAAHGSLRWVLIAPGRLPRATRPFAVVGAPQSPNPSIPGALPRVIVKNLAAEGHGEIGAEVINRSSVPQYQLQVYAVARRGSRYLAAAQSQITELDPGASRRLDLQMIGSLTKTTIALAAPPTIFG